jgi:hypothetical protein
VRKRVVSYGPRSVQGAQAWDTFQTLLGTAKKLGVNFFHYWTGKGLISFAAQKCRGTGEKPEAAKVMRPRGELNRDQTSGYGD